MNIDLFSNSDIDVPSFVEDEFNRPWLMTRPEKYALIILLNKLNPETAIEVGTKYGGSLSVLAKYAKKVYSIDIDPQIKSKITNLEAFDNVSFEIGDSKDLLPRIMNQILLNNEKLQFVLLDGDHSVKGIKRDIECVLGNYSPSMGQLFIVIHDSFNPNCRKGICSVEYQHYKFVKYVELDFIPGVYSIKKLRREMWGGLALIVIDGQDPKSLQRVHKSQQSLFAWTFLHSKHFLNFRLKYWIKSLIMKLDE